MKAKRKYLALFIILVLTVTAVMPIGMGGGVANAASPVTLTLQNGLDGYNGSKDVSWIREFTLADGSSWMGYYAEGKNGNLKIYDDGNKGNNALIYFDVSQIPDGATITSAKLNLYSYWSPASYGVIDMYRITDPDKKGMWVDGDKQNPGECYFTSGAAYLKRNGGFDRGASAVGWTNTAGSTIMDSVVNNAGSPVVSGSINITSSIKIGWDSSSDIKDDVQAWVDGTGVNQGWYLRARKGAGVDINLASDQAENNPDAGNNIANRPQLVITYTTDGTPAQTETATPTPSPTPTKVPTPTPAPTAVVVTLQNGLNGYTGAMDNDYVSSTFYDGYSAGLKEQLYMKGPTSGNLSSVIYFDTSQIPESAVIDSAQLVIQCSGYFSGTSEMYKIIDPDHLGMWREGTKLAGAEGRDGVAYGYRDYNKRLQWTNTQGSTILDSIASTPTGVITITNPSENYVQGASTDVKADVQAWVNKTAPNQGWYLSTQQNLGVFASSQNSDQAKRPKLIISYHVPAAVTPPTLTSLTVANPLTNPSLTLSLDNLQTSGYYYQIWSYEEYGNRSSDGSDGDSGAYWRLVKGYGDSFTTGNGTTSATETWQVKGALGQTYKIFIRVKDPDGAITQLTKEFSSKDVGMVRINSILLDNNIPVATTYKKANQNLNISVLAEGDGPLSYEYYFDNQKINGASGTSYDYTIPSACEQGYHTIKAKVSNSNDFDEMSVNIYVTNDTNGYVIPEISSFTLNQTAVVGDQVTMTLGDKAVYGNGVSHTYQIGEPGRGYFSTSQANNFTFSYPGVYQVFGSVRNTNAKSFSDGAIKYITVSRTADDAVNAIKLTASDVQIKNLQTLGTVTPGSIAANTQLQFNATAERSNVQYSFWRLDARGYRLVQDWSTQYSLNWTPTQPGNYTIQVRVRDAAYHFNNASYEAAQSFNFNVTGCSNNTSAIDIVTPGAMVKRTPVAITANATAPDVGNLLYRFEINDSFMGTYTVQDYSLSNTCTWIPRKAGDYKIIVRVRDQGSYGYYDSYQTKDVTVTDQ